MGQPLFSKKNRFALQTTPHQSLFRLKISNTRGAPSKITPKTAH
jgi:hypothetical protein